MIQQSTLFDYTQLGVMPLLKLPPTTEELIRCNRPHIANNSGDSEWYTPAQYIEAARLTMGGIDLDPASCEIANATVQATTYFTEDDNGLAHDWHGRVWLNPPYAKGLIDKFCRKLVRHYNRGDVQQAIVLVNNATETVWFQTLNNVATAVLFPTARVRFVKGDGKKGSPLQGQAILYFGPNVDQFAMAYAKHGRAMIPVKAAQP